MRPPTMYQIDDNIPMPCTRSRVGFILGLKRGQSVLITDDTDVNAARSLLKRRRAPYHEQTEYNGTGKTGIRFWLRK